MNHFKKILVWLFDPFSRLFEVCKTLFEIIYERLGEILIVVGLTVVLVGTTHFFISIILSSQQNFQERTQAAQDQYDEEQLKLWARITLLEKKVDELRREKD